MGDPTYLQLGSGTDDLLALGAGVGADLLILGLTVAGREITNFDMACRAVVSYVNKTDGDEVTATASVGFAAEPSQTLANGTAEHQANRAWQDTAISLTSGGTKTVDLYDLGGEDIGNGAGQDSLGQTLAMSKIICVLISNQSTSAGSLLIGGEGTAAAWSTPFNGDDDAKLVLPPDAYTLIVNPKAGYDVTDSSDHLLKFEASGGAVTFDYAVIGRST